MLVVFSWNNSFLALANVSFSGLSVPMRLLLHKKKKKPIKFSRPTLTQKTAFIHNTPKGSISNYKLARGWFMKEKQSKTFKINCKRCSISTSKPKQWDLLIKSEPFPLALEASNFFSKFDTWIAYTRRKKTFIRRSFHQSQMAPFYGKLEKVWNENLILATLRIRRSFPPKCPKLRVLLISLKEKCNLHEIGAHFNFFNLSFVFVRTRR